ncbi:hypothetical protein LQZ18_01970 [Lachnospiraceae bacterium ZAX-1]
MQKTDLKPEQQEFVETVLARSKDLRSLINDFYDISAWEAKESIPELKRVNLDNLLANIVLVYTEQFEEKAITPHILFSTEPTFVIADESMLMRVVDNLISNALKYGVEELKISISKDDEVSITFQKTVQDEQRQDNNLLRRRADN